jgi:hypothetical protein
MSVSHVHYGDLIMDDERNAAWALLLSYSAACRYSFLLLSQFSHCCDLLKTASAYRVHGLGYAQQAAAFCR